jgi:hypothetical protein
LKSEVNEIKVGKPFHKRNECRLCFKITMKPKIGEMSKKTANKDGWQHLHNVQ